VSLELAPEQVKKITVAEQLGKLSLAVRSAVDQQDTGDTDTTVVVYAGNKVKSYSVKKHDTGSTGTKFSADVSPTIAR
jgi:pilus assembly protein CpaB